MRYFVIIILALTISCTQPLKNKVIGKSIDPSNRIGTKKNFDSLKNSVCCSFDTVINYDYQSDVFSQIKMYRNILDTNNFIKALKENCHIRTRPAFRETINYFKKINIYGSDQDFYIIEYDFHEGATSEFPWKYQIVFDDSGKLIKLLSEIRVDIVTIFPKKNPFLIGVSSTGHGNGWHEIIRIEGDTLKNVYDGLPSAGPQTYDTHQDNSVNDPSEFHYRIKDVNNDGYNDIVFFGKIVLIQGRTKDGTWYDTRLKDGKTLQYSIDNPYKKIPVAFTFLYNINKKKFIQQENYSKKYAYIFGDTK